jgi:hypothetical protein
MISMICVKSLLQDILSVYVRFGTIFSPSMHILPVWSGRSTTPINLQHSVYQKKDLDACVEYIENDLRFSFPYKNPLRVQCSFSPDLIYGDDLDMVGKSIEVLEPCAAP